MPMASKIFKTSNYVRIKLVFVLFILIIAHSSYAQENVLIQIKTFDQQLKPLTNLSVSLNGKEFIAIEKTTTFHEVNKNDLPPKSVVINKDEMEAESWTYSKGVLEIMIRKKNYKVYSISLRSSDLKPVNKKEVKFSGLKAI